jgi:hypothetical protein
LIILYRINSFYWSFPSAAASVLVTEQEKRRKLVQELIHATEQESKELEAQSVGREDTVRHDFNQVLFLKLKLQN